MKAKKIRYLLSRKYFYLALIFFASLVFYACVKKTDDITQPPPVTDTTPVSPPVEIPITPPPRCAGAPDYGDSVICGYATSGDFFIYPRNFPGKGLGQYVYYPQGLVIDPNTGIINLTKSESGLVFHVGWVAKGSKDTCYARIITSGISYMDGIHVLSDNDTVAVPIYNGDPSASPVCGSAGLYGKCSFDNPIDAGGVNYTCNAKGIKVDTSTGVIGLNKSLLAGLFGILPKNGDNKTATLVYRLDDCSNMALRKISVNISYYTRLSDVPQTLVDQILTAQKNMVTALFGRESSGASTNPRPPHIVIVASH